jgi:hypothetical protein
MTDSNNKYYIYQCLFETIPRYVIFCRIFLKGRNIEHFELKLCVVTRSALMSQSEITLQFSLCVMYKADIIHDETNSLNERRTSDSSQPASVASYY